MESLPQQPHQERQEQIKDNLTDDLLKERIGRKRRKNIGFIVAVVLLIAGAAFGYWKYSSVPAPVAELPKNYNYNNNDNNLVTSTNETSADSSSTPFNIDAYASQQCEDRLAPVASKSQIVQWQEPKKIDDLHLFAPYDASSSSDTSYQDVSYVVGKVLSGKYQDGDFIVSQIIPDGPSVGQRYRLIYKDGTYYYLEKYSDPLPDPQWGVKFATALIKDSDFDLPDLDFPDKLTLDTPKSEFSYAQTLAYFKNGADFFCADHLVKVFTDPNVGDVYTDASTTPSGTPGQNYYIPKQGFYVKAGDSSLHTYQLTIPIVDDKNNPLVTWKDGKQNTDDYTFQTLGGCGASNFRDIADVKDSQLTAIGTAFDGTPVYTYKDQNAVELKNIYDNIYTPDGETKPTYAEFIAGRPIFFWKDAFGKYIRFQNKKFMPMAECGKPVIYLYPTQTEKISVQVSPVGGMSYGDPSYNSGWNVVSDSESNIKNLADGKTYPYLFWEGRGGLYETPTKGFVVEKEKVHALLEEKLSLFGLNEKERQDFESYWEPKMQSSPYYFVSFVGNDVMDALAPLTISPKPDTIIRVLMDFTPLEHPISAEGYNIPTPKRTGFTVVEWGGVLR